MKMRFFFQIFLFFLLLILWNFGDYLYRNQKQNYFNAVAKLPLIIYCNDSGLTDSLETELGTKTYILRVETDKKKDVGQKIIDFYKLNGATDIITKYDLPNVLKVYFQGDKYFSTQKKDILSYLLENRDRIEWRYNDDYWNHYQHRIYLLDRIFYYFNIFAAVFIFLVVIYARVHAENKKDEYYRIYYSAGGSYSTRWKNFIFQSIFLSIFPSILTYAIIYSAISLKNINIILNYQFLIYQFLILLAGSLISALFLWRKL